MKLRYPAAKCQPKADAPGFSAAGFIHHIERLCNAGQISGRYSPALIGDADFISGSLQTDGITLFSGFHSVIYQINKKTFKRSLSSLRIWPSDRVSNVIPHSSR